MSCLDVGRTTSGSLSAILVMVLFFLAPSAFAQPAPTLFALQHRDFRTLEIILGGAQAAYENGTISDVQLRDAFLPLEKLTDPDINSSVDWANQSPGSYAAQISLAIAARRRGAEARGEDIAENTPAANLQRMTMWFLVAEQALTKSQSLTAKPILTVLSRIQMLRTQAGSGLAERQQFDQANKFDPSESIVRTSYMLSLEPQWGGGISQMQSLIDESTESGAPAQVVGLMQAVLDDEMSRLALNSGDKERSIAAATEALRLAWQDGDPYLRFIGILNMAGWYCNQSSSPKELRRFCVD